MPFSSSRDLERVGPELLDSEYKGSHRAFALSLLQISHTVQDMAAVRVKHKVEVSKEAV
jgi:hypothetical protein